jgi:membrane-bound ClpP family serine protease
MGFFLILIGVIVFVVSIFNPADLLIGGELLGLGVILLGAKLAFPKAKLRLPKM